MENVPDGRSSEQIRRALMEGIPERCQACPMLGRLALLYAQDKAEGRLSGSRRRAIERRMFPRTANRCPDGMTAEGACGSLDA
jgi:hypothetical protein